VTEEKGTPACLPITISKQREHVANSDQVIHQCKDWTSGWSKMKHWHISPAKSSRSIKHLLY
jgi:hypothetical protein